MGLTQAERFQHFTSLSRRLQIHSPLSKGYQEAIGHNPETCDHTEEQHQHFLRAYRASMHHRETQKSRLAQVAVHADEMDDEVNHLLDREEISHENAKYLRGWITSYRTAARERDRQFAWQKYGEARQFFTQRLKIEEVKPPAELERTLSELLKHPDGPDA